MKNALLACASLALLASLAVAQPVPEQMKRLDRFLGDWVGSGTSHAPGQPAAQWTSRSSTRAVLGGRFLRTDSLIEIKAGPQTLQLAFIGFITYDVTTKRYLSFSVGNTGEFGVNEVFFSDDDTTVTMSTKFNWGEAMLERWTTVFEGDTQKFRGEVLGTAGALYTQVQGSQKKVEKMKPVDLDSIGTFMTEVSPQMKTMHRMNGVYSVSGSYTMAHGQEPGRFEGTENIRSLFGGLVQINEAKGDGYEAIGLMVWDARESCFRRMSLNSMGMAHEIRGHLISDRTAIFHFMGSMMNQQMLNRTTLEMDEHGKLTRAYAWAMADNHPPFKSFAAEYSRKK